MDTLVNIYKYLDVNSKVVERFCKYVRVDTQSDPLSVSIY